MNIRFIRNSNAIARGCFIAACIATGILLLVVIKPPNAIRPTSPDVTSGSTRTGDNRHNRGGVIANSQATNLPLDWPDEVPVPDGKIVNPSGLALSMILDGPYDQVVQAIHELYTNHGFISQPKSPLQFENPHYVVSIAIENRDHSAVSNNVSVVLSPKKI